MSPRRSWRWGFGRWRVTFGLFSKVGDYRMALLYAGCLFLPATVIVLWLPELSDAAAAPADESEPVT